MIKNSRVAIIIVNWKKYNITVKCIESVIKSNYPNYEIILVDNESDTSKVSKFKYRKNVKTILNSKNEGFSKANNQGIKYALKNNFDYILLLNNDTVIKSNLIDVLIKTAQAKKVYAVQPLILNHDGKKNMECWRKNKLFPWNIQ